MAKTFFPSHHVDVPASRPHPPGTLYRVSAGLEFLHGEPVRVRKVQLVRLGKVMGTVNPSFPADTDDMERVFAALTSLTPGAK